MNKVIDKGFRSCRFVSTIVKHPAKCFEEQKSDPNVNFNVADTYLKKEL